jgi:hypothetical protein
MNIIFDAATAKSMADKYTILELDTVMQPGLPEPVTLHALVEVSNVNELATLPFFREMHSDMIREYKSGNWQRALELISGLMGQFNGELDNFYENVIDFCQKNDIVSIKWDGIRHTVPKE